MEKQQKFLSRFWTGFTLNLSATNSLGKKISIGIIMAVTFLYSASKAKVSFSDLLGGMGHMWQLLMRMFPPNWSVFSEVFRLSLETLHIAYVATLLAFFISLPLSFFAAKNVSPHPIFHFVSRQVLNVLRGVPELIFALLFVAAVGLGPFAGVMALTAHTVGVLGKLFAEYIESSDIGPKEAITSTGANPLQVFFWGILPQIMPEVLSLTFYRFEVNVRSATVLGFVGAGGIGFYLLTHMRLLNYSTVVMCILAILVMVSFIDWIGSKKK